MTVNKIQNGTDLTVEIAGRLDTTTAPQLEQEISGAIDGAETLAIDMKDLEYISSAGLRVLLSTHKKMAGKGGMVVKNANEVIMDIFDVTGFADILTIEK